MTDSGGQQRSDEVKRWFDFAPEPRALPEGFKWDIFISYRSTDRPWALGLYDLLSLGKWKVFLDQLVLPAGSDLRVELQRNLRASASGVLLFSKNVADSDWVAREQSAFTTMRDKRKKSEMPFHYVVAKLDETELDLFEQADIYVDYSDSPEGPHPSAVLRLMYGLVGKSLTREALGQIEALDKDQKRAEAQIRAARRDGDLAALRTLAASTSPAFMAGPSLIGRVIEAQVARREQEDAEAALAVGKDRFPESVRLMQLEALIARRRGDWRRATRILGTLYDLGHRDPETLGIYGAAYKVRAKEEPAQRENHLKMACRFYEEGFRGAPDSHYCGVNAAGLDAQLGNMVRAKEIAAKLVELLDGKPAPDRWAPASLGDAKLILGDVDGAIAAYGEYGAAVGYAEGDIGTTVEQIVDHLGPALDLDGRTVARLLNALGR